MKSKLFAGTLALIVFFCISFQAFSWDWTEDTDTDITLWAVGAADNDHAWAGGNGGIILY